MPEVIISDTSCLLVLHNTSHLFLLRDLFGTVLTTGVVAAEFNRPLPEWVVIVDPVDTGRYEQLRSIVDPGEASAIALALEHPASKLILDDMKGRALATDLGLAHTGTIGILKAAKNKGYIPLIGPLLTRMRAADFWISDALEDAVLKEAGER